MYAHLPAGRAAASPAARGPLPRALRLLLRLLNMAWASVGLALIAWALVMEGRYRRQGGGGGGGEPPAPAPELGTASVGGAAAAAAALGSPWFVYLTGGVGCYVLATAAAGLKGAAAGRRWLAIHIALVAALVLAEAGAALLLFTDNAWRGRIPADPSGNWEALWNYLQAAGQAARVAALAVIAAQLAGLAAACGLHSLRQAAYEAWLDDREEAEERTREVLAQTVQRTYAGGAGSVWAQRMEDKYGVSAASWQSTARAALQVAPLAAPVSDSHLDVVHD